MSPAAPSDAVRQFTVGPDDDQVRLDRWFKRNLPEIGFATISRWARTGQIRVDGKRVKPEDRLEQGQRETVAKPICGRLRLNQRSSRMPSSSSETVNCRTLSVGVSVIGYSARRQGR